MSAETDRLQAEIDQVAESLRDRSLELEDRVRDGIAQLAQTHPLLLLGGAIAAGMIAGRALNSPVVAALLQAVDSESPPR